MAKQKKPKKIVVQSCTSRECKKIFKDQITELCEAITTVHEYNHKTKKIKCTVCGKVAKIGT